MIFIVYKIKINKVLNQACNGKWAMYHIHITVCVCNNRKVEIVGSVQFICIYNGTHVFMRITLLKPVNLSAKSLANMAITLNNLQISINSLVYQKLKWGLWYQK